MDFVNPQFAAVENAEFCKNAIEVVLHRLLANGEFLRNFLIAVRLSDESDDFLFTAAQRPLATCARLNSWSASSHAGRKYSRRTFVIESSYSVDFMRTSKTSVLGTPEPPISRCLESKAYGRSRGGFSEQG
jgi:hypothetical protein